MMMSHLIVCLSSKRHDIIILKPEVTAKKVFGETEVKKEIVTKVETFQKFDK